MFGAALILVAGYVTAFPGIAADAPASLTINVYTCDAHHDPIDPNQTLLNECNLGTADLPFTLESIPSSGTPAMASTGAGGHPATIGFSQLPPGEYRLTLSARDGIAFSYIAQCASDARTFTYPFSPFAIVEAGGRIDLTLLPGEHLSCDWYNVEASKDGAPAAASALTVTAYDCSGDVFDASLCNPAPGVELLLTDAATMFEHHLVTGPDGSATFDGAGAYTLTASGRQPCGFAGDVPVTADALSLTLDPAHPIAIQIFYCQDGA